MISIWIFLLSCCWIKVAAISWPSCSEITNTQDILNLKDGGLYTVFRRPTCYRYSPGSCYKSCCQAELNGRSLKAVMASADFMTRYYVDKYSAPTGVYPMLFFYFNNVTMSFDVAEWNPANADAFKFKVHYHEGHALLVYDGNVPEGANRLFAPYLPPDWIRYTYDTAPSYDEILYELMSVTRIRAMAQGCSCGYHEAIEIGTYADVGWCEGIPYEIGCYQAYTGVIKCIDIDECAEGTHNCDLIDNSYCVNTIGSFECICNPGGLLSGGRCFNIGTELVSRIEPTSTSARFFIESTELPKPSWSFLYDVFDITNPAYPLPVYLATQVQIPQDLAKTGVSVSNLSPGRNYTVRWEILDENNTVITNRFGFTSHETRFKTLCTCGLLTDAPILLGNETITQEYGYVYFKFLGNSVCGNAYTFARQSYDADGTLSKFSVFTPNYFFTAGECSPIPYEPGKSAADVLAKSKLTVGGRYRYSIRAVGEKYLGDTSSVDFVVHWECSINGFIGLQPSYGSLPVEGVIVTWYLNDENGTVVLHGSTTTSKSGRFTIHPNAVIPLLNDRDYPMHLSFQKFSEIDDKNRIQHRFLCNNGSVNCTDTDHIINLKHLDFDIPVNVIDATSVPVSGSVYVADTRFNPDGTRWGGDGCPVQKAKVCLTDLSVNGYQIEPICTETAADGTYVLAGVIGSRVAINVTFNNHSFQYVPVPGLPDFSTGVEIQPNRIYDHNDFIDTTIVPLQLIIAGGFCDLFLGPAVISYSINGCLWGGATLYQSDLRNTYNSIPAQNLKFSVDSVINRPDIDLNSQNVDLTHATSKQMSQGEFEHEQGRSVSATELRFQYNGTSKIRVEFAGDKNINHSCTTMTPNIVSPEVDSVHVLPFQLPTVATIFIERDLGKGLVCDAVDPSTKITIQNNLGLLANDPSDETYAHAVASAYPLELVWLLYRCNKGCVMDVVQNYDSILKRNKRARVEFQFMTGRPNNAAPFIKRFMIQTEESNPVSYTAAVVITGQYKKGHLYSMALPTYQPILIIRDPPGGTSYSFYENVQTTLRVDNYKHTEYMGLDSDFKILGGVKAEIGQCAGLGYEVCSDVVKVKDVAGFHGSINQKELTNLNFKAKSGGFTTTWSYKTPSSNPLFTGAMSDTYVIPNLNMKFSMIDTVSWNQSICTASMVEETAFNLQSPENEPALSFVTELEILNTEIPSLELSIASTLNQLEKATDPSEVARRSHELKALRDALQGWKDTVALNADSKRKVASGSYELYKVKPHQWFDKIASKNEGDIDTDGMSHNTALLSEDLMSRAKLRPLYGITGGSSEALEATNTIKFSGGGNEFTFRLSKSKMTQHVSDLGGTKRSSNYYGGYTELDNTITLFNLIITADVGARVESEDENLRTDEKSASTSIGFVLSDPDAGDQFDVDVFLDPEFGTFIFHTRSGKSVCKHEVGTENRQLVQMELVSIPSRIVLEDEPIVFHFQIKKSGVGSMGYILRQELREDVDALIHYPLLPREYPILEFNRSFITSLTLRRGPEKYEYPAFTLLLQPACEYEALPLLGDEATVAKVELYNYIDPVDQSKKIVFARPCAPIVLRGEIANDQTFKITSNNPDAAVTVVVQNPTSSLLTWADATQDSTTRLQRVQLYYRQVGSLSWHVGQHMVDDTLVDIDFALSGLEDAYGFVTIEWAVSHLADGNYEMQIRTICDEMNDAPAIFNGQETEIIQGVFDRKPPKLYTLTPQSQLEIGQPIRISFNKPLYCSLPYIFIVEIRVNGIEKVFDNNNLLLICEDRYISVQFDASYTNMTELIGKSLSMSLTSVSDSNGNLISWPVTYSVDIVDSINDHQGACQRRQLDELFGMTRGTRSLATLDELEEIELSFKQELAELRQSLKQDEHDQRVKMFEQIEAIRRDTHNDMLNLHKEIIDSIRKLLIP